MSEPERALHTAVIGSRDDAHASNICALLDAHGAPATKWYRPYDADDVSAAIRKGTVARVVFPSLEILLDVLWLERANLRDWQAAGVPINVAGPTTENVVDVAIAAQQSWQRWRAAHRRRQVVAGVLLSVVALAAAFGLLLLLR